MANAIINWQDVRQAISHPVVRHDRLNLHVEIAAHVARIVTESKGKWLAIEGASECHQDYLQDKAP